MLLAVAGLSEQQVHDKTKILADKDWSKLTPQERVAFHFAKKQAKTPWDISADDIAQLEKAFGRKRMLDVIYWACRCHYMTKVADAFQIPLETENVFMQQRAARDADNKKNGMIGRQTKAPKQDGKRADEKEKQNAGEKKEAKSRKADKQ